ncbi:MAG: hypothetical protein Q9180_006496, partial [Flavoplaca navasiana]
LFGPFPISYITEFLNKRYERKWTGDQVVRAWRKLQRQQETEKIVHEGQALYVSRKQYEASKSDTSEAEHIESIKKNIDQSFVEIMESEMDDSEFFVDVHLDHKAADGVTVLSSKPGELGKNKTTDNMDERGERNAKEKALEEDLKKWEEKVAKGSGPRPAKWCSATGFNSKYYYKPKGPQKGDPWFFIDYNMDLTWWSQSVALGKE